MNGLSQHQQEASLNWPRLDFVSTHAEHMRTVLVFLIPRYQKLLPNQMRPLYFTVVSVMALQFQVNTGLLTGQAQARPPPICREAMS